MSLLGFLARRFVAGETADAAIAAALRLNAEGIKVTLDNLGEDCASAEQAAAAVAEYRLLLRRIAEAGVDGNVSLKLTQLGLNIDPALARDNLERVASEAAAQGGNFVRIDMEGSAYTQRTLDLFYELLPRHPNLGVVIQACLRRSEADVRELARRGARVRLCKGAYKEPAELAFQKKSEVDQSYDRLAGLLVAAPLPAFATHDDARIAAAVLAAERAGLPKGKYEIQMLYGLRRARWRELAAQGHAVRVYMPYGTHWLPYFSRRLRERKENLIFVLRNLGR
ncbi:MAG: proline dehydrogenase family protein [Elusimicrobia bacterium]|nr:proline dehydrogenase family protein [Elusimicrobiota bacterium]MDE2424666.1 proline dehydrogenase family protein [Elusimicrobiota bacterium]